MAMVGQLEGRSSVTVQVIPRGQGTDRSFSIHVEEIQTVILVKRPRTIVVSSHHLGGW